MPEDSQNNQPQDYLSRPEAASSSAPEQPYASAQPTPITASPTISQGAQASNVSSVSRTVLEVAGLILAVVLIFSMANGLAVISQTALFIFAAIGVFAVFRDVFGFKKAPKPDAYASRADYGGYTQQTNPVVATPSSTHRKIVKSLGIGIVITLVGVFVLPYLAMMLFLVLIMFTTGGKGS